MQTSEQALQSVMLKASALVKLSETITPQESPLGEWHRHILRSLALTAVQSIHHINSAFSEPETMPLNLNYLAWAVRSLYEVRLWVRVAVDPEQAGRFMGGIISDGFEMVAGFDDLVRQHLSTPGTASPFDGLKAQLDVALTQIPFARKELKFNIGAESKKMGLEQDYASMYKFMSKLAHVTATSAIISSRRELVDQTAFGLLLTADDYIDDIIQRLATVTNGSGVVAAG